MRAINRRQHLLISALCLAMTVHAVFLKEATAWESVGALVAQAKAALDSSEIRRAWRLLDLAISNYPSELLPSDPIWGSVAAASTEEDQIGRVRIATWLNWADGAVSCTFDDSLMSAVDVVLPDLNAKSLFGTFYVYQGTEDEPAITAGYIPKWQTLALAGHEIGNHSKTHPDVMHELSELDIINELDDCQLFITTLEPVRPASTFAYPFGNHGPGDGPLRKHIRSRFPAARTTSGPRIPNPSTPSESEMEVLDSFSLASVTPMSELNLLFEDAIASRGWLILTFHAVVNLPGYEPISQELWDECLKDLKDYGVDMWVNTVRRIASYIYARRTAVVTCDPVGAAELRLKIQSKIPKPFTDPPVVLSVSIRVPPAWSAARIVAPNGTVTYHCVSANRIKANVIPDGQTYRIVEE